MNCLNCSTEMTNTLVQTKEEQISYDICETCGSFWLDAGELDKMALQVTGSIEYSSQEKAEDNPESTKRCPRCAAALYKVVFLGYSDISLDHCKDCGGFWLDGGELDLINKQLQKIMPTQGKGFSEFVNNVHLPNWHKRVTRKSSETDYKIEVPPIKDAELKSETSYKCPTCEANLNLYAAYGIEIEGCPRCKGLFLDSAELGKLKDKSEGGRWQALSWMDDEVEAVGKVNAILSRRACPTCEGEKLVTAIFGDSSIMIDWCPKCHGTWMDRGEFQEIVKSLEDKLNRLSSTEMKDRVKKEIKEIWNGPEGAISEILDVKAAISALIGITIFEHPRLSRFLSNVSTAAHAVGV